MAVAIAAAKIAIQKVQLERQRKYEESILTEEQKQQIRKKEREREERREREKMLRRFEKYKSLAVFRHHEPVIRFAGELTRSFRFQMFMILVICVAGVLVGMNTYDVQSTAVRHTIMVCELVVVIIFVLEIFLKLLAEGSKPWHFFYDGWNVFDFLIVVIGFFPIQGGSSSMMLRLLRLFRTLKLVKALPKLRILVMGLLMSLSSIAYIGLLLLIVFYIFGIVAVIVFGKNDPVNLGTLHIAVVSLFRAATLEDWTDLMYTAMYGCDNYGYGDMPDLCKEPNAYGTLGALYWVVFIFLASLMILNLFIGVITTSMEEAKDLLTKEMEEAKKSAENDHTTRKRSTGVNNQTIQEIDAELQSKYFALAEMMKGIGNDIETIRSQDGW